MKIFQCSHCENVVYFDNQFCTACHSVLGFDSRQLKMCALTPEENQSYKEPASQITYKFCANHIYGVCNWILEKSDSHDFCIACRVNRVIPNLSEPQYRKRWQKIELAKHRLMYSLLRWNLPVEPKSIDPKRGLAFDFKADPNCPNAPRILTGHDNGLITLNIAEADDVERAMARKNMDEVYRTLLGHFRHEIGHYYWDILVDQTEFLNPCRELFGDDRASYQEALDKHYHQGPPVNWMERYISSYATMHPWEDWAETWAHYLHIIDVLETADTFGMRLQPQVVQHDLTHIMHLPQTFDPYLHEDFEDIYQAWLAVSLAMNSLNRSMGHDDFYPFVINLHVKEKLRFIHQVIQSQVR
ncbi:hypothetical protein A3K93_07245 [Acinetobacter sp. NCu2D-2]|uniref:zinc-binding metallopeptidase family protein n=1 Tax=Acinetobacter sp. NCu2D-2 TaxID=1608473 RepID=UPI0007CDEB36|nr:putative zinc-binding metallopeptidase [Acinetobacter sp. NCu2D-2]ANF82012.1 hypothetical protein A3K93_07245 [Acinetobacter sp. NCu2D-2]